LASFASNHALVRTLEIMYISTMSTSLSRLFSPIEYIFIAHILGVKKETLYLKPVKLTQKELNMLSKLNKQFELGVPIDYIIGSVEINNLKFGLNKNVLIPRPETEDLIEYIKKNTKNSYTLVDIGTGCGLIGISLANTFEKVMVADISQKALNVAKSNSILNNCINIATYRSDLLKNKRLLANIKFFGTWTIVANLPYIPTEEQKDASKNNILFEPTLALYSGDDGLDCFRKLIIQLEPIPNKPIECYFELDPGNIHEASNLLKNIGYYNTILKDQNGLDRFLIGSSLAR
jgi:release factor glutamine methyltransferase